MNLPVAAIAMFDQIPPRMAQLRQQIERVIVGQRETVDALLISLFCQGHVLIVGVPGLAKTLLVRTLAQGLGLSFRRIQFTPDMMPSDIIGTELIQEDAGTGERHIRFVRGPLFAQLVLADEINRTPPRTQSALLEAMAERQVTVGGESLHLEPPFVVVATQNPVEQEGTYPLPEAQLDRFMMSLWMDYPDEADEVRIVSQTHRIQSTKIDPVCSAAELVAYSQLLAEIPVSEHVARFAVTLARRTRPKDSAAADSAKRYIEWGAGPRAAQAMVEAAKVVAAMDGRPVPGCEDVRKVALPVLRHRIVLNYAATGEGLTADALLREMIEKTPEPSYR